MSCQTTRCARFDLNAKTDAMAARSAPNNPRFPVPPREPLLKVGCGLLNIGVVASTLVDLTGAPYPERFAGTAITPMQGVSLIPALSGQSIKRSEPLYWQWRDTGAIREGNLKAVFSKDGTWQLYDLSNDRNEMNDLAKQSPERLQSLKATWQTWFDSHPQWPAFEMGTTTIGDRPLLDPRGPNK